MDLGQSVLPPSFRDPGSPMTSDATSPHFEGGENDDMHCKCSQVIEPMSINGMDEQEKRAGSAMDDNWR